MDHSGHTIGRREFLKHAGLVTPLMLAAPALLGAGSMSDAPVTRTISARRRARDLSADLVIIGGGLGGCAAALAAARNHLRVILTEETDWIGGQLTQQAVPPDENAWIETFGGTRSYQTPRTGIRQHYAAHYPLTDKSRADKFFNPGNCWVSRLGCEPRVALAVLTEMLAPYVGTGQVRLLLRHKAVGADTHGNRVDGVRVVDLDAGHELVLRAPFFADATEQGDLLPLTGTEYAIGAESRKDTNEPDAKDTAEPGNLQGFTCCFAMDYLRGEDHVMPRPRDYAFWRDFSVPDAKGAAQRLLSFEPEAARKIGFDPEARTGFWSYRRIADRDLFAPGFYRGDVTIVNWGQNDYPFGAICDVSASEAERHIARAKQLSLSLLYWLQTEAPRPDGGAGWKGLRLRPDVVGTTDGLAKYPYIREGRRIRAEFTVLQQHVVTELRMRETGLARDIVTATKFADSVGIGSYRMDLHTTTTGDHGAYGSTLPFQIPLGALIPQRVENLVPACKNLGVTHLTNGCYRLHPVEWNVGEAAGALVAFCLARRKSMRDVRQRATLLGEFQQLLTRDGVPLDWPREAGPI